jgi:hypothetical protein
MSSELAARLSLRSGVSNRDSELKWFMMIVKLNLALVRIIRTLLLAQFESIRTNHLVEY